jgi:hypothetical protein
MERVNDKEKEILKSGLKDAAHAVLLSMGKSFDDVVFPVWQRTIHTILVEHNCPCTHGQHELCFMHLGDEEQREAFRGDDVLDFTAFAGVVEQGLMLAPQTQN